MIKSSKPRKQRHFRFNADLHTRQHFVHAHLDKSLRTKLNIKKRAVQISKGDTVKVMTGKNKGKTGKVIIVNTRRSVVYLDSLKKKNARGKEYDVPISSSNVYITDLNLTDKKRAGKLRVKAQPKPVAKEEVKEVKEEKPSEIKKPVAAIEEKAREKAALVK